MFESYLTNALVERFGQYIEGIDKDNLQVAAWNGEVRLEGLRFKPDAFESLNLPLRLDWGTVGRFHLTVPWKALGRQPIRVTLEDIEIVLVVEDRAAWSKAKINARASAEKDRKVESIVTETRKRWREQRGKEESESTWAAALGGYEMLEKLLRRSVENLELEVKNVHVRIEEKGEGIGTPCSFCSGITLKSFVIRTDNSSGSGEVGSIFKDMVVDGLAVYWDSFNQSDNSKKFASLGDPLESSLSMKHCYLMKPISPTLKITFRNKGNKDDQAKVDIKGSLDIVALTLSARQGEEITSTATWIQSLSWANTEMLDKLQSSSTQNKRPIYSPKESPREWWIYSIRQVIDEGKIGSRNYKRRKVWKQVIELAKWQEAYVKLFSRKLLLTRKLQVDSQENDEVSSTTTNNMKAVSVELSVMETTHSVSEIAAARSRAYVLDDCAMEVATKESKVTPSNEETNAVGDEASEGQGRSWFGGFFSSGEENKSKNPPLRSDVEVLSEEDKKMLLESLDDGVEEIEAVSDTAILATVNLELRAVMISICDNVQESYHADAENEDNDEAVSSALLTIHMVSACYNAVIRPCGWRSVLKMKDVDAWDGRPETAFSHILRRSHRPSSQLDKVNEDDEYAVSIAVTTNPNMVGRGEIGRKDKDISAQVAPFELMYVPSFFNAVRSLLSKTGDDDIEVDKSLSSTDHISLGDQVKAWRDKRARELLTAITTGRNQDQTNKSKDDAHLIVDIRWDAPLVVCVEDYKTRETPIVVADLGHFRLRTIPQDDDSIFHEDDSQISEKFRSVSMDEFHDCDDEFDDSLNSEHEVDNVEMLEGEAWRFTLSNVCLLCGPSADLVIRPHNIEHIHDIIKVDNVIDNLNSDYVSTSSMELIVEQFEVELTGRVMSHKSSRSVIIDAELPKLSFILRSTTLAQIIRMKNALFKKDDIVIDQNQSPTNGEDMQTHVGKEVEEKHTKSTSMTVNFKVLQVVLDVTTEVPNSIVQNVDFQSSLGNSAWNPPSSPLIHATLGQLAGSYNTSKHSKQEGSLSVFKAAVRSLDIIDRYQQAGPSFEMFISSTQPSHLPITKVSKNVSSINDGDVNDLVTLSLDMTEHTTCAVFGLSAVFIEWNPDTLVAIHDFMNHAKRDNKSHKELPSITCENELNSGTANNPDSGVELKDDDKKGRDLSVTVSMRSVSFCFNKETMRASCHLAVARVDDATFKFEQLKSSENNQENQDDQSNYEVLMLGDTRISAKIGNLSLIDVSTPSTLYPDILGLQKSGDSVEGSILEFSYTSFHTKRAQNSLGYGNSLILKLSPMRLVYVQQYILELWDYIFQAVLNQAVLGGGSSQSENKQNENNTEDWSPPFPYGDLTHRRNMHIEFASPVLVLPVHPLSPAHLECDLGIWTLKNSYSWMNSLTGEPINIELPIDQQFPMDVHRFDIIIEKLSIASVDALTSSSFPIDPPPFSDVDVGGGIPLSDGSPNKMRVESSDEGFFDALEAFDAFEELQSFATLDDEDDDLNKIPEPLYMSSQRSRSRSSSFHVSKRVKALTKGRIGLKVNVSWPADGRPIMPKGRSHQILCDIDVSDISLELRHADYFLFRRLLDHNIGAISRIPAIAIGVQSREQELTLEQVLASALKFNQESQSMESNSKNVNRSVAYNYDEVGTPTTYALCVQVSKFGVLLVDNANESVTALDCTDFSYKLKQTPYKSVNEVIGETELICGSIVLSDERSYHTPRCFKSFLRPLKQENGEIKGSIVPTLQYESRTHLVEGVVHTLTISEACMISLPGAFGDLSNFVSYEALEEDKINAIFVACRFPRMFHGQSTCSNKTTTMELLRKGGENHKVTKPQVGPHMKFNIHVARPHFVLVSDIANADSVAVVLNCDANFTFETHDVDRIESSLTGSLTQLSAFRGYAAKPYERIGDLLLDPSTITVESSTKRSFSHEDNKNEKGNSLDHHAIKHMHISLGEMKMQLAMSDIAICLDILDDFNRKEPLLEFKAPDSSLSNQDDEIQTNGKNKSLRSKISMNSVSFRCMLVDNTGVNRVDLIDTIMYDLCYTQDNGYSVLENNVQSDSDTVESSNNTIDTLLGSGAYTSIAVRDMQLLDMRASSSFRNVFGSSESNGNGILAKFEMLQQPTGERKLNCQFNVIEVAWHPALVARLHSCIRWVKEAQKKTVIGITSPQAQSTTSVSIPVDSTPSLNRQQNSTRRSDNDLHIVLDVILGISSIRLRLDKEFEERSLLCFTMRNTACRFRRSSEITQATIGPSTSEQGAWLEGSIGEILIEDACSRNTLYRTVISTHKSVPSLARFSYRNATMVDNLGEKEEGVEQGCNLLSLSLSSMKFIYLQQFWLEIVDYVNEGILGDAVNGTLRTAGDWMAQQVSTKTAIKVDLAAPSIVIPENCNSLRALEASLSTFIITTTFDTRDVTIYRKRVASNEQSKITGSSNSVAEVESLWFKTFKVSIGDIDLSALEGGTSVVLGSKKNADVFKVALTTATVNLSLNVSMPVDGKYAEVLREKLEVPGLGLVITGDISPLVLRLDERRYVLLKAVASGNFGDQTRHGSTESSNTVTNVPPLSSSDNITEKEEVAFNYGNEDAPVNEINVNINVEQAGIQISFIRTKDTHAKKTFGDENGNACIELQMNTGVITYHRATNLHSSFDISLSVCSLRDLRPNRIVRTLISPAKSKDLGSMSKSNSSPQIVFHMANRLKDGKSIDVILNRTLVNVAYDPLICFYAFLQSTSASVANEIATITGEESKDILKPNDTPSPSVKEPSFNLKMKLLLHNPLVCFWENERSPSSKVLSLRGLAVVDIAKQYSTKTIDRFSLRLDKLESFMLDSGQLLLADNQFSEENEIVADSVVRERVETDDGFEDAMDEDAHVKQFAEESEDDSNDVQEEGCSLLEPVSMYMTIERISEPLHPTKRDLNMSLEPIAIRFSKENCLVLTTIMESWSKALKSTLENAHIEEKLGHKDSINENDEDLEEEEERNEVSENGEYVVVFHQQRLGITLQRLRGSQIAFVESFHKVESTSQNPLIAGSSSEAAEHMEETYHDEQESQILKSAPDVGDIIIAVGDDSVIRNSYDTTVQMIRTSPRPLRITFRPSKMDDTASKTTATVLGGYVLKVDSGRRIPEECAWNEVDTYVFNRKSLDGLSLSKGGDGEMLVIKSTQSYEALHVEHGGVGQIPRMPRTGSILVGIDGISVEGVGFDRCVSMLSGNEPKSSSPRSSSHQNKTNGPSMSTAVLVLRWREVENWPHKDTISLSCAGFEALLVEDERFRSVPLVRLGLGTATIRADLGYGLSWRWLSLSSRARGLRLVGSSSAFGIDAFNRRVGAFEPFLEPCDARVEVEAELRIKINESIANQTSSSDREEKKQSLQCGNAIVRLSTAGDLNVNITEAFAETLKSTQSSWTRKSNNKDGEDAEGLASLTSPKQLPFIFHNMTGEGLSFTLHQLVTGSSSISDKHRKAVKRKRRIVPAGTSLSFGLFPNEKINMNTPSHVHTGPINFVTEILPLLTVEFDWEMYAPICGLQIGSVGKRICSTVGAQQGASKPGRISLLWEVVLIEGQHHLTLRSAVAFENNMGASMFLSTEKANLNEAVTCADEHNEWSTMIKAGESQSLPLKVCLSNRIFLRIEDHNWSESTVFKDVQLSQQSSGNNVITDPSKIRSLVLCRDVDDHSGRRADAHTAAVFLSTSTNSPISPGLSDGSSHPSPLIKESGRSISKDEKPLMIHCYPGAAIRSLLPTELIWSLRVTSSRASTASGSKQRSIDFLRGGVLQSGEKTWLPTVRDIARAEVQVKVADYRWSSWSGIKSDQVFRLLMKDDSVGVLTISAELCSLDGHAPTLTFYADYWLRNLSSLPVVYGCTSFAPRVNNSNDNMYVEHGGCKGLALGYGGSETRVFIAEAQGSDSNNERCSVTMEMFQCAVMKNEVFSKNNSDTVWCDCAGGRIDPASYGESLSSSDWTWANNWTLDQSGGEADSLDPNGWETSSSGKFLSSSEGPRKFHPTHKYWRRRWTRTRIRRDIPEKEISDDDNDENLKKKSLNDKFAMFQLPRKFRGDGSFQVDEGAKLVLKVKDSRWSSPIDLATTTEGGGGAVDIIGGRWLVRGADKTNKSGGGEASSDAKPNTRADSIPLYELAYSVVSAPEPWNKSRIVVISDRYRLVNRGTRPLMFKQCGELDSRAVLLQPGQELPLHWTSLNLPELIVISFPPETIEADSTNAKFTKRWLWSGGICPLQVGSYTTNVRPAPFAGGSNAGASNGRYRTVKVHAALGAQIDVDHLDEKRGSGIVVSLIEDEGSDELPQSVTTSTPSSGKEPLIRIENFTHFPIFYAQNGVSLAAHPNSNSKPSSLRGSYTCDVLPPRCRTVFGWDVPCPPASRKSHLLAMRLGLAPLVGGDNTVFGNSNTKETTLKLVVGSTATLPSVVSRDGKIGPAAVLVITEGLTTVVRILRIGNRSSTKPSNTYVHEEESRKTEQLKRNLKFCMFFNCLRVSILVHGDDKKVRNHTIYKPREILVGSLHTVFAEVDLSQPHGNSTYAITIGGAQIDNHLPKAPFPVLLTPKEGENTNAGAAEIPLLAISLSILPRTPQLIHIKHLTFRLSRRLVIGLDESIVQCLTSLAERLNSAGAISRPSYEKDQWPLPPCFYPSIDDVSFSYRTSGQSLLVELASIYPVKLALSLQRSRESRSDVYVGWKPSKLLMDMLRCENAHITLDSFQIEGSRLGLSELRQAVSNHYSSSLRRQLFAALGSLAAIGDPVGFVRGLAKGASDAFNEPLTGLARAAEGGDLSEVRRGFSRGAMSFTHKTVGGVANSAGLITSSIGTAGSSLALDKDFKLRRAEKQAEKALRPQGLLGGLGTAGTSVADGVLDGITGLVTNPVKGYASGGLKGAVRGAGRGAVGLFVKPVVGITDAATDVFQGIQGSTAPRKERFSPPSSSSTQPSRDSVIAAPGQVRPRRALYGTDRLLKSFSSEDALAAHLFIQVCAPISAGEEYCDHVDLGSYVLLLSSLRLCIVDDRGALRLLIPLKDIACCEVIAEGLLLHLFDPVAVAVPKGRPTEETLVRFIKCSNAMLIKDMDERIQRALRSLS